MDRINELQLEESPMRTSKYIRNDKEKTALFRVSMFFLFAYFVLPQYFGLNIPVFDLTAQRIGILVLLVFILEKRERVRDFVSIIRTCKITPYFAIFLFILSYTAVIRTHAGTFLYTFIEMLGMFLVMYVVKYVIGFKKTIKILLIFTYILCILGLVEYVLGRSLFSYLETISGLYTGAMVRSGSYRIMGPANHSLAYGLILITVVPLACIDTENDKINILQNIKLLILLVVNIFLTGSRSTLAVFFLEMILLVLFSGKKEKKKTFLFLFLFLIGLLSFVIIFYNSSIGRYVLLQITSIIDEILGTTLAVNFGADINTLINSSAYRDILPKIFTLNAFNPLLGKGSDYSFYWYYEGFSINSIDNYYVATYIRYAYPGLISYVLVIISALITMLKTGYQKHSGLCFALFVGSICYFINLWWLDTLQTIKYVYILFALFYVYVDSKKIDKVGKSAKWIKES